MRRMNQRVLDKLGQQFVLRSENSGVHAASKTNSEVKLSTHEESDFSVFCNSCNSLFLASGLISVMDNCCTAAAFSCLVEEMRNAE
jgi:hypothetical protein